MSNYKVRRYRAEDSMSELICDNFPMLLIMSRFGINLGFGDDTIAQVCAANDVDLDTFLLFVNIFISTDKQNFKVDYQKISLPAIVKYLKCSHDYFLEYRFPVIRQELIEALEGDDNPVSIVVVRYFDEYVAEVRNHMMHEERVLFPYINSVLEGSSLGQYSSEAYREHHDEIAVKLSELKNIIIKYYPSQTTNPLINVLYDIFSCERDLASHSDIEDLLLVPALKLHENLKG